MAGCMALAACGGGATEENVLNADDANLMTDMNAGMTDLNTTTGMNAADGMNATENAMVNDVTTNDPDTNLANGY
jgi:hypothetical protein